MPYFRICPKCHRRNHPDDVVCLDCMTDVSSEETTRLYEQTDTDSQKENHSTEKVLEGCSVFTDFLILITKDGRKVHIKDREYLGRGEKGADIFSSDSQEGRAVSKKHACVFRDGNDWFIQDLCSTNGTYVNGIKLEVDDRHVIRPGDTISLSLSSIDLTVL